MTDLILPEEAVASFSLDEIKCATSPSNEMLQVQRLIGFPVASKFSSSLGLPFSATCHTDACSDWQL